MIAIVIVALLRAMSVVVRRYFAAMLDSARRRRFVEVLSTSTCRHRCPFTNRRPTGELLAHADADIIGTTELLNRFPFVVG